MNEAHKSIVCATFATTDRSKELADNAKDSQIKSEVGRKGPEPRSVLGAPPYSCRLGLAKRSDCDLVVNATTEHRS